VPAARADSVPAVPEHAAALRSQLAYLERTSSFYAERLCAPHERLVRIHVTSGIDNDRQPRSPTP
jgi:hypothetical protein